VIVLNDNNFSTFGWSASNLSISESHGTWLGTKHFEDENVIYYSICHVLRKYMTAAKTYSSNIIIAIFHNVNVEALFCIQFLQASEVQHERL
jgi:hypothetical protein